MSIAARMKTKIEAHLSPVLLKMADDSAKHAGHESLPEGMDESHIGMLIVSEKFKGLSRVARTRLVYDLLAEEIAQIHAVTALKTLTPEEYAALNIAQ